MVISGRRARRPINPARLEAELVFTALIERLPDLELPEKEKPDWRGTFTLRGLHKLPAVWH